MALRMDDSDKLKNNLKPGGMQSTGEQAEGMLDTAASYLPGNSKPRDALNDDAATPNLTHDTGRQVGLDAFKPAGEQGPGGYLKTKMDQGMSHLQREEDKSSVQQARDAATPGNASAPQKQGQGLLDRVGGAMKDMKDAVVGGGQGTHHETR